MKIPLRSKTTRYLPLLFLMLFFQTTLSASDGMGLEPKVAFRGVKGMDHIFDMGANLTFVDEKIGLMAMYHSTKSTSFGLNAKVSKNFNILGLYSSNTGAMAGQTNGSFELNLKLNLFGEVIK